MTLDDLKAKIGEYLYLEDTDVIDVILATIIANMSQQTMPIWMTIIGAPSGGKTQLILPLEFSQPSGKKFIHRITDLTPNTFLSGAIRNTKDSSGNKMPIETSLLKRIGTAGIMLFPDLTSLFSKDPTELQEILGTLRHIYDGALTKMTGNGEPIEWEGKLGVLGASTSELYRHLERFSSMGERLMYYRMKPVKDRGAATDKALDRSVNGKELDTIIAGLYSEYIKDILSSSKKYEICQKDKKRLRDASLFASLLRTNIYVAYRTDGARIERFPESEMPMRTALQLMGLAQGFLMMNKSDELSERQMRTIEWCAWSLANDERRKTLACMAYNPGTEKTGEIAAKIGMETDVVRSFLLQLSAIGIVSRKKETDGKDSWTITDGELIAFVRRIEEEPTVSAVETIIPIDRGADDFENF